MLLRLILLAVTLMSVSTGCGTVVLPGTAQVTLVVTDSISGAGINAARVIVREYTDQQCSANDSARPTLASVVTDETGVAAFEISLPHAFARYRGTGPLVPLFGNVPYCVVVDTGDTLEIFTTPLDEGTETDAETVTLKSMRFDVAP